MVTQLLQIHTPNAFDLTYFFKKGNLHSTSLKMVWLEKICFLLAKVIIDFFYGSLTEKVFFSFKKTTCP